MNPETILQKQIEVALSDLDAIPYRMQVGNFYTNNMTPIKIGIVGTPDLMIICPNGMTLWYEIKTKTGKTRNAQDKFHEELRKLGHLVFVVRSVEQAVQIYNTYVGKN